MSYQNEIDLRESGKSESLCDSMDGLVYCLQGDSWEDAMGHCGDVFRYCMAQLNKNLIAQGDERIFHLMGACKHYIQP